MVCLFVKTIRIDLVKTNFIGGRDMSKYLTIFVAFLLCTLAIPLLGDEAWTYPVNVFLTYEDGAAFNPPLGTNYSIPNQEHYNWCEWHDHGLWWSTWMSDSSLGYLHGMPVVSDTFFPGDSGYGHILYDGEFFGQALYVFNCDNFAEVYRLSPMSLEEGDTLHLRFIYRDPYDQIFVWGLDTVFHEITDDEINIHGYLTDDYYGQWEFGHFPCLYVIGQEEAPPIPDDYYLSQSSPNPFNASTEIDYYLPEDTEISINVYDIEGRLVRNLVGEYATAGHHKASWDGADDSGLTVPSGTYMYKLETATYQKTRKMLLLK